MSTSVGLSEADSPCLPAVIEQNGFIFNVKVAARPYQGRGMDGIPSKKKD
jgi:hypothetical protein